MPPKRVSKRKAEVSELLDVGQSEAVVTETVVPNNTRRSSRRTAESSSSVKEIAVPEPRGRRQMKRKAEEVESKSLDAGTTDVPEQPIAQVSRTEADAPSEIPTESNGTNADVPFDILNNIFKHLYPDFLSVASCALVCKSWYDAAREDYLWEIFVKEKFDLSYPYDDFCKGLRGYDLFMFLQTSACYLCHKMCHTDAEKVSFDFGKRQAAFLCRTCSYSWGSSHHVVSHSRAQKEYKVSEKQLKSLPCKTSVNPHNWKSTPMRLYIRKMVQDLADGKKIQFHITPEPGEVRRPRAVKTKPRSWSYAWYGYRWGAWD